MIFELLLDGRRERRIVAQQRMVRTLQHRHPQAVAAQRVRRLHTDVTGADHYRVRAWLSSPLYVGLLPHKGETYEGDHKPAVTREVWDAARNHVLAESELTRSEEPKKEGELVSQ